MAALLACAFLAAPGSAVSQTSINEVERATVRIAVIAESPYGRSLFGTGSGFVVAPNLAVTNAHVVAPARQQSAYSVVVVTPEGDGMTQGRIVAYSPLTDLALIEFRGGENIPPATISLQEPHAGDAIVALGYPDVDDLQRPAEELVRPTLPSRSTGAIASLRDRAPTGDPLPTINHEASLSSGSSGGPLVDECGRVIGVNTWHARGADTGESRGVATRVGQLISFLEEAGVGPQVTDQRCLNFAERISAERAETVAALEAQNKALASKLETADRLTRIAVIILIAGTFALLVAVGVLGALLLSRRRHPPPSAEAEAPHQHHRPHGHGVAAVVGAAAVAAIVVIAVGVAFLHARADRPPNSAFTGSMTCVFEPDASIVERPAPTAHFTIDENLCVNERTQYALAADGRSFERAILSGEARMLDILSIDPESGRFSRTRHRLDDAAFSAATAAAGAARAEGCGGAQVRAQVAARNAALARYAGGDPEERTVWLCLRDRAQSPADE